MKQLWRLITFAGNAIRRHFLCLHLDRIEVTVDIDRDVYVSEVTGERYHRNRIRSVQECPDCGSILTKHGYWGGWHKLSSASEQEAETKSGGVVPPPKQIEMTYFRTEPYGKVRAFIRETPDYGWEQILFPREID